MKFSDLSATLLAAYGKDTDKNMNCLKYIHFKKINKFNNIFLKQNKAGEAVGGGQTWLSWPRAAIYDCL